MAQIELTLGNLTASVTSSDANATRILQGLLIRHNFNVSAMSGQEQADAVVDIITDFVVNSSTAQEAKEAADAARDGVLSSPPSWA